MGGVSRQGWARFRVRGCPQCTAELLKPRETSTNSTSRLSIA
jgi:hypothetical protein